MSNQTYVVKSGDTLGRIAHNFGVSPQSIANNSHLNNLNKIRIGQKLIIGSTEHHTIASIVSKQSKDSTIQSTWDKFTNERIKKLHPSLRLKAYKFINEVQNKHNIKLRVSTGLRTIKDQNILYKQGRTTPGKKVTNAKGGRSYHNYGLAIDVVEIKNGKPKWNTSWDKIATIAKKQGFEWGGDWKSFKDKPHFQISHGCSTKQLLNKLEDGNVKNGYIKF